MREDRYYEELYRYRGKLAEIRILDSDINEPVFRFRYPKETKFKIDDFRNSLIEFFNRERKSNIEKLRHHYALKLSGKYPAVYVCSQLDIKTQYPDDDEAYCEEEYDGDEFRYGERHAKPMHGVCGLKRYTIAKLCEIDYKTCTRMIKNLITYLEYLTVYLKHKTKFDTLIEKALASRKKSTKKLILFKTLLLNPFESADKVGRRFHIAGNIVRQYVKRLSDMIVDKAYEDGQPNDALRLLQYNLLIPFRSVVFGKAKGRLIYRFPRVEHDGVIIREDEKYKL